MLRYLYKGILRLHPKHFRELYGDEILAIFDQAAEERRAFPLLADGIVSLVRQWIRERDEPLAVTAGAGTPLFHTFEDPSLSPGRLLSGALLSWVAFATVSIAIKQGGNHPWHPMSLPQQPAGDAKILNANVPKPKTVVEQIDGGGKRWALRSTAPSAAPALPAPANPGPSRFARDYVRLVRVLDTLDADHDGVISAREIANSTAALKRLDMNHDGKLTPAECGFRPLSPAVVFLSRRKFVPAGDAFVRFHPVLAAIDTNHDGFISAEEMENAPTSLRSLDANGDGRITEDEYLPDPVTNEVTILMSRLDVDGDGRISRDERQNSFASGIRGLLDTADQNRDGVITEQELRNEIRRRADLDRNGIVTWREMLEAMASGAFGASREK